jgi:hypothetical protein
MSFRLLLSFEFQSFSELHERDKRDIALAWSHSFRGEICTRDILPSRTPVCVMEHSLDVDSKWVAFE